MPLWYVLVREKFPENRQGSLIFLFVGRRCQRKEEACTKSRQEIRGSARGDQETPWWSSTVPLVEARTSISFVSLCSVARNLYDWRAATTWSLWCPPSSPWHQSVTGWFEEVPLGLSHWGILVCCYYLMFVLAQGGYLYVHGVWPGGPRRPAPSSGRGPRPFYNSGPKPVLTLLSIRAFRLLLCQEIVRNKEHPVLGLFREFEMTVYCFPDPDDPAQVFYMLYINLFC